MRLVIIAALAVLTVPAHGQSFTCRIGTNPTCLGYGDKVCSSSGKCVDSNAACFDSYQCGYDGFTCKSNVTKISREYDDLVTKFNDLLDDHKKLQKAGQALASDFDSMSTCLRYASSLDEAQRCARY